MDKKEYIEKHEDLWKLLDDSLEELDSGFLDNEAAIEAYKDILIEKLTGIDNADTEVIKKIGEKDL